MGMKIRRQSLSTGKSSIETSSPTIQITRILISLHAYTIDDGHFMKAMHILDVLYAELAAHRFRSAAEHTIKSVQRVCAFGQFSRIDSLI